MNQYFVGRQPILDENQNTWGYEVLFRSMDKNSADVRDGVRATSEVILNSCLEEGLQRLLQDGIGLFNFDREGLLRGLPEFLPKDKCGVEILETVEPDPEVVATVRRLADSGYLIALDDFVERPDYGPLIEIASMIKVEVLHADARALAQTVKRLRKYPVKLLAEKVETGETFDLCRRLGFDYFQGYFFRKPEVISGRRAPVDRLSLLRTYAQLQSGSDLTRLADSIRLDPGMTYRLLVACNSAMICTRAHIDSVAHALALVGQSFVARMVALLFLTGHDDQPREAVALAVERAAMCERIGRALGEPTAPDAYFTAGLLSLSEALLDRPLSEALARVPLDPEIAEGVLRRKGRIGKVLQLVERYQAGNWNDLDTLGLPAADLREAYLDSVRYAREALSMVPQKAE